MSSGDLALGNLPFGIFRTRDRAPRAGVRLGDQIIDLAELAAHGHFNDWSPAERSTFSQPTLNTFVSLGKPYWRAVRDRIGKADLTPALLAQTEAQMLLPVAVGDYVDFYSSEEHATNLGKMFRDPANPLPPSWKHLPIGYHGRTSSIIVSGGPVRRPRGQLGPGEFGPSRRLDFELEVGFIVGKSTGLGTSVRVQDAEDYIFGLVLLNDWSARDIQRWEYVPLGPFLGKSFATSITPWIITLDELEPFRVEGPAQNPAPLPYLRSTGARNFDIHLEILLQPEGETGPLRISSTNFRHMYWNMSQQIAHLTSNGTNLRVGDLCGSGAISGDTADSTGSLIEITANGSKPIRFPGGATRTFLEDADTVVLRAYAERPGIRVDFGELRTKILPAAVY